MVIDSSSPQLSQVIVESHLVDIYRVSKNKNKANSTLNFNLNCSKRPNSMQNKKQQSTIKGSKTNKAGQLLAYLGWLKEAHKTLTFE